MHIITNQRNGSTWLTRLLDNDPQIRMLKGDPVYVHSGYYDDNLSRYCGRRKTTNFSRPWALFNYLNTLEIYESELQVRSLIFLK